ncbi:MAG: ATP-binding protein [Candidatus Methanomethylicaceae archaeon]
MILSECISIFKKIDFIIAIINKNGEIKQINEFGKKNGLNEGMKLSNIFESKIFEVPEKNLLIYGSIVEEKEDFLFIGMKLNYKELLEALPIPSILSIENKIILDVNKEFLKKYHYDENIKYKNLNEILKFEDKGAIIIDSNGDSYNVNINIINLPQSDLFLILLFEEDLTPLFIHQIKNVLQSLMMQIYFIKQLIKSIPDNIKSEFEVEKFIQLFQKTDNQINILGRLVDLFHSLYRKPIKEEVEVSKIIREVISSMNIPDNIEVKVSFENDSKLKLDFFLLMNALMNIIDNSINAMPSGGTLEITMNKSESNLIVKIRDTGGGMTKEILDKIFTPYFTTKKGGTGLGLYIARKIIEKHNGKIMVESELGKGTTFSIILPLK